MLMYPPERINHVQSHMRRPDTPDQNGGGTAVYDVAPARTATSPINHQTAAGGVGCCSQFGSEFGLAAPAPRIAHNNVTEHGIYSTR